jgi:hypothetical protein
MFLVRAHTEIRGYAIAKKDWDQIMKEFPQFKKEIDGKIL